MSFHEALIFDSEQLPLALETREEDVLQDFYALFQQQLDELQAVLASATALCDRANVRQLAHKLKSSSLAVGAIRLGEALAALEESCLSWTDADIDVLIADVIETSSLTAAAVRVRLQTTAP